MSGAGNSTQEERNAEIWATRVQRELLAMTTDNIDPDSTEETRMILPPFCSVKEHMLNITEGACLISFQIEVSDPSKDSAVTIIVTLDASMPRKPDGSFDSSMPSYPFQEPLATLTSGQSCFPAGSTIKDGERIAMDLDWTPSLHFSDAILNIGLKVKESILQQEAFHAAPAAATDPILGMTKGARRFASHISKASTSASSALTKAFAQQGRNNKVRPVHSRPKKKKSHHGASKYKQKASSSPGDVSIGDEINLLEERWLTAHGVYSCKAIRRPEFVEKAMKNVNQKDDPHSVNTPTAMFRSFTQSARSVLEESFLMITETHIIEMKASKLNMTTGKVSFSIPVDQMAKLKFRRQESVSLFFKSAPEDPLVYMCPDSGDVVHQIQNVLKRHGVKGKHTNAAAHRAINDALQLVQEIQTKELALKHDPTVQRVNDIMDLYRQAAERFEVAGDVRHEEVVTHMRKFLALPLTTSILDGSYSKPPGSVPKSPQSKDGIPEGEVLARPSDQLEDEEMETVNNKEKEKENDKAFEENIDNLLKEAQEDVQNFLDDDPRDPATPKGSARSEADTALADVAADLDAMMREADKELAALMSS